MNPANASATPVSIGHVAVIGAGQLGQMLAEAALRLGYQPHILAKSADEPATQVAGVRVVVGEVSDPRSLAGLLDPVDLVTFESELTPPQVIAAAAGYRRANGKPIVLEPSPAVMAVCGDKLRQKELLLRLGVPTAKFEALPANETAGSWLTGLSERFGGSCVIKWARGGYDGRGTMVLRQGREQLALAQSFVERATAQGSAVYAESFVPFTTELAVITSRSTTGEVQQYSPVLTTQTNGICTEVIGPAISFGLSPETAQAALDYARRIGESLAIAGTYAVEYFVQADATVVVNEIAPRVHNSGHFTLDGAETSQFENHWRGVLGLPLGSTSTSPFFGMVNLIGGPNFSGTVPTGFNFEGPGIVSYWYGKAEVRPGRKIGHINVVAENEAELRRRIEQVKVAVAAWQSSLTKGS